MAVLLDLCYIAVDLNSSFMYNNIENFNLKDIGTTSDLGPKMLKGRWDSKKDKKIVDDNN